MSLLQQKDYAIFLHFVLRSMYIDSESIMRSNSSIHQLSIFWLFSRLMGSWIIISETECSNHTLRIKHPSPSVRHQQWNSKKMKIDISTSWVNSIYLNNSLWWRIIFADINSNLSQLTTSTNCHPFPFRFVSSYVSKETVPNNLAVIAHINQHFHVQKENTLARGRCCKEDSPTSVGDIMKKIIRRQAMS